MRVDIGDGGENYDCALRWRDRFQARVQLPGALER